MRLRQDLLDHQRVDVPRSKVYCCSCSHFRSREDGSDWPEGGRLLSMFGTPAALIAIAHPAPASVSPGRLADITKRTVSNTEARLAFAVLTTERKAA